MPTVTITKADYDEILWKAVADRPPSTTREMYVMDAVLTKLETLGTPESEDGARLPDADTAPYLMTADEAPLDLTEEEAAALCARLEQEVRRRPQRRLRSMIGMLQPLEAAVTAARAEARTGEAVGAVDAALVARRAELQEVEDQLAARRDELADAAAELATQERAVAARVADLRRVETQITEMRAVLADVAVTEGA